MATLTINNPIKAKNANATGASNAYLPEVNAAYGPYTIESTTNMSADIVSKLTSVFGSATAIPLGVTVGVQTSTTDPTIVEYWNPIVIDSKPGILVVKANCIFCFKNGLCSKYNHNRKKRDTGFSSVSNQFKKYYLFRSLSHFVMSSSEFNSLPGFHLALG